MSDTLRNYYEEAAGWDRDRETQQRRVLRMAYGVAGAGWVAALLATVTLMGLTPLKRTEPYLIRVDNSSGIVDVVPVYAGKTTFPEAVARYFLTHYVTVCERFSLVTAESDYEECGAFHTTQRNQTWAAQWARSNPKSPLNLYRDGTTLRSEVSAVSFFDRSNGVSDLAQVRYTRTKRQFGGAAEDVTHWIATVQYVFAEPSSEAKVRRWNPLGFKVLDFHVEPEVLNEHVTLPAVARSESLSPAEGSP